VVGVQAFWLSGRTLSFSDIKAAWWRLRRKETERGP